MNKQYNLGEILKESASIELAFLESKTQQNNNTIDFDTILKKKNRRRFTKFTAIAAAVFIMIGSFGLFALQNKNLKIEESANEMASIIIPENSMWVNDVTITYLANY